MNDAQKTSEENKANFFKFIDKLLKFWSGSSFYKEKEEYKIQIRYADLQRNNITDLMNMRITYRDFSNNSIKQVPLNAVATVDYTNTSGAVKRKNVKRTIQIQSNVTEASLAGPANKEITKLIEVFKTKINNSITFYDSNNIWQLSMKIITTSTKPEAIIIILETRSEYIS
jgi:Cu/Ag efflux pump CusA